MEGNGVLKKGEVMSTQNTNPVKISNTTGPPPLRKNNHMSKGDEYKLMGWIDANRDYIRNSKMTSQKVAEEFQNKTGIVTTLNNVKSCCKALGVLLSLTQKRVSARAILISLREEVKSVSERLVFLEEKYRDLCKQLGVVNG